MDAYRRKMEEKRKLKQQILSCRRSDGQMSSAISRPLSVFQLGHIVLLVSVYLGKSNYTFKMSYFSLGVFSKSLRVIAGAMRNRSGGDDSCAPPAATLLVILLPISSIYTRVTVCCRRQAQFRQPVGPHLCQQLSSPCRHYVTLCASLALICLGRAHTYCTSPYGHILCAPIMIRSDDYDLTSQEAV